MAAHNTEPSPLLRLPAELRNHIYELVLRRDPVTVKIGHSRNHLGRKRFIRDIYRRRMALTQACRTTRKEGLPIYYADNDFVIKNQYRDADPTRDLHAFLDRVGPVHARHLRSVTIHLGAVSPYSIGEHWIRKSVDSLRMALEYEPPVPLRVEMRLFAPDLYRSKLVLRGVNLVLDSSRPQETYEEAVAKMLKVEQQIPPSYHKMMQEMRAEFAATWDAPMMPKEEA